MDLKRVMIKMAIKMNETKLKKMRKLGNKKKEEGQAIIIKDKKRNK